MATFELFVNYRLNFDEVIRRMEYWTTIDTPQAKAALRLLVGELKRNRTALHFETEVTNDGMRQA